MKKPFRWGIIGPGRIAHKFAQSLPYSENGKLTAVASTSLEKASDFAKQYGAAFSYGSYEEMLGSGNIDAVYVATPHTFHLQNSALAIEFGIPVLCEKPLTDNHRDSSKLISKAKEKGVFLMEGMWSVFLPHLRKAFEWVRDGKIGNVVHVQADFGYRADFNPEGRLFNPKLGGGVVKDVGIYPLAFFYKILGPLQNFQFQGNKAKTEVDQHVIFQGKGNGPATFQGMVSFLTHSEVEAIIFGTDGKIKIESQWLRPTSATLFTDNGIEKFESEVGSFGFQSEANEVEKCVVKGQRESAIWSLADALAMSDYISKIERV